MIIIKHVNRHTHQQNNGFMSRVSMSRVRLTAHNIEMDEFIKIYVAMPNTIFFNSATNFFFFLCETSEYMGGGGVVDRSCCRHEYVEGLGSTIFH